jgi:hypothetical protein
LVGHLPRWSGRRAPQSTAIGTGVPLFDAAFQPFRFQLVASHACPSGVLFLTYRDLGDSVHPGT